MTESTQTPTGPVPTPEGDLRELTIDVAPAGYDNEQAFAWLAGVEHGTARVEPELARLRAQVEVLLNEVIDERRRRDALSIRLEDEAEDLRRENGQLANANITLTRERDQLRDEVVAALAELNAVSRLSGGNTPADAEEREDAIRDVLARHGITAKTLSEDEAVDLLVDVMDEVRGWGSAVATPEACADGPACPEHGNHPAPDVATPDDTPADERPEENQ